MSNNRTTELREKLTERGVDWLDESNGYADVTTFIANGAKWTVISKSYLNLEHDWMMLRAEHITPEQAIAATLGSGNANTDDALALLDEIREAGRISYDDYSQLFDAIAELGGGTCETEARS